jgi:hypothetical protein
MTLVESAPPALDRPESVEQYRLSLFAWASAVAVLFHLAGNAVTPW